MSSIQEQGDPFKRSDPHTDIHAHTHRTSVTSRTGERSVACIEDMFHIGMERHQSALDLVSV